MESLREIYDSMNMAAVETYITERRQEDLHLDFKRIARPPQLCRDDMANLAKVLSGFANSDGGICVWGVVAEKDDEEVDAATRLEPIRDVEATLSKFNSITGGATDPPVRTAEHQIIPVETPGTGLIKTLVLASDGGPHMAKQGEFRYYGRSGDRFYRMEHFQVADMFGRRRRPDPQLGYIVRRTNAVQQPIGGSLLHVVVTFVIVNLGRSILRFPALYIKVVSPYTKAAPPLLPRLAGRHLPGFSVYMGPADCVIHAGAWQEVVSYHAHFPPREIQDLRAMWRLAGEDMQIKSGELVIRAADLERGEDFYSWTVPGPDDDG